LFRNLSSVGLHGLHFFYPALNLPQKPKSTTYGQLTDSCPCWSRFIPAT
jgi:hypothetical protein